tara:strand:+ start:159 stop:464 length:306 start_codon:yes stop_codon:yes gene_type:complete
MNHRAIYNTHPNVVSVDDTLGAFDKDGNNVVLDQDKVDVETAKIKAELDAQEYARNRAPEYPSIGDQMDMIYKDNLNGTTTHKDAVEAIKTKWPKDNSGPV